VDLGIAGKTALISGASVGIGRVTAKMLASEGVQTIVVARREAELQEPAAERANPTPMLIVDNLLDGSSYKRV
jgi:3-oxoacyl-[acyl-carrier protein] reductase